MMFNRPCEISLCPCGPPDGPGPLSGAPLRPMRLDREQALAIALARECGALALSYQTGDLQTHDKPDGAGPVTRADTDVNSRIVRALHAAFPDDDIVAEE